eukprot:CAMPEP_0194321138 /NCGR_PEP_ID=MMETSP0171-20130528/17376_1 /TAXON_ID=218684 /ORGANISM="Corethron pennatum, Strain L29A3" /LENGTH=70 /DNA_ID=CAMNT_0039078913 /DNA_START=555 /DNA_END=767 /DNA_ORIENTATION=-
MGRIHWRPAGGLDLPIGLQGGDLPGPREHKEDTVFDRTQRFTLLVDDGKISGRGREHRGEAERAWRRTSL